MKYRILSILFLSVLFISKSIGQVTVTASDTVSCLNPCTMLTAHVEGDLPIASGISIDDEYPTHTLPLGFTFTFYGVDYHSCLIGPNGTICFDTSLVGSYDDWEITGPLAGNPTVYNSICGPWSDIDIVYGGNITYSTDGVAPNRKFVVTYCATHMFSCTTEFTSTQFILYEGTNTAEVHLGHRTICTTGWNGSEAIIGVENATGTKSTVAPGRDYTPATTTPPLWTASDEAWRFTPDDTGTGVFYDVSSIGYAPIPYAINPDSIYWYNATTGAYLGVGDSMYVCPTGPTLYRAGKLGCADTSFGYYFISINPIVIVATPSNPTKCGLSDGFIVISGLLPGTVDTVNYIVGGVDSTFETVVSSSGTITISNLRAGMYTDIIVTQNGCNSAIVTAELDNPPISITSVDVINPSFCGISDGSLVLHGLYGGYTFSIVYDFNGVTQPAVTLSSNPTGDVTIPALFQGVYNNIVATIVTALPGACVTPPMGPYTLTPPPTPIETIANIIPVSQCGFSDGQIILRSFTPYTTDTVNYSFNGTVQPSFVALTAADSTIAVTGLPVGSYSGFSVTIGECIYVVNGIAAVTSPTIVPSFDTSIHLGCHGDTVFFNNTSSQYFDGVAVTPGPLYYIWSFGDGTSDTSKSPYHIFATQGTYNVQLVADNHQCTDTIVVSIPLLHPLFDSFTASTYIVCQDSTIQFTNNSFGTTGKPVFYDWYFGDGTTSTDVNPAHSFAIAGSYNVQLVAHDYVPCYDTFSAIVQTDTLSGIQIAATDTVICQGTGITFTGLYSSLGNTGVTWNFGDGDSIKNVNPVMYAYNGTGEFTITSTAIYRACDNVTTTRNVVVLPTPVINLGPDTSICAGGAVVILENHPAVTDAGATWLWSTGATTPSISINADGLYWATVSINNCYASDSVNVLNDCYMDLPNVFTPNNDGVNDFFYPRQWLTKGLISFKMEIYNRWGQNIYEATTVDGRGWDGKLNGKDQPEGVYVYVIDATFKDGQKEHHQGNITLLR